MPITILDACITCNGISDKYNTFIILLPKILSALTALCDTQQNTNFEIATTIYNNVRKLVANNDYNVLLKSLVAFSALKHTINDIIVACHVWIVLLS
jgi:hypothetical protein